MSVDIIMPKMGESIMEGTILKWHKQPGDKVDVDETILEISTDKVDTEVPSPEAGVVSELLFNEGDVVEVGKVIAKLNSNGSSSSAEEPKEKVADKKVEIKLDEPAAEIKEEKTTEDPAHSSNGEGKFYSPLVLNIAQKEGIGIAELEKISGTGVGGRVSKKDILNYLQTRSSQPVSSSSAQTPVKQTEPQTPKAEPKVVSTEEKKIELPKHSIDYNEEGLSVMEFDNVRQKMAEHMIVSKRVSPHVQAIAECDMTNIDKVRLSMGDEFLQKEGFKLTYMPFICEAVVKALKDFPLVNSIIDDSVTPYKAITRNTINLGIAVAMNNGGLIVPVIHNADGMNLIGIARSLNDLAKRARIKKLTLNEIQGGTFSLTNFGVFGNDIGIPIINQPQVAILGLGSIKKRPVVIETQEGDFVVPRKTMIMTLSFDHRLVDGALGGMFTMRIAHYLENYSM
ncbi:MAG TPA: dihydrolipoamide acetyltransferase family protein [Ignavibacteria bacterium]|nr:dihydrolipoamide acetyltransferase family protein [Ignavibacteria bacterium]HMR40522.1 dihydrolipoamide acetyltransferase family protein [Ignavibacteria bacterium]